jgi:PAS domain-containing protein
MTIARKTNLFLFSFFALFLFTASQAKALTFNPNNILSDAEMLDAGAMTLEDIRSFLNSKGGYISKNSFPDAYGTVRSAAEIIHNAAYNADCDGVILNSSATMEERRLKCRPIRINPKMLIVLLQKEMSLIEAVNPTQRQLDFACGYGCPDGAACSERWRGFGKQVNSASLQFYEYMMNPHKFPYQPGKTYTVTNTGRPDSVITPANRATAALYSYTPHVYNGNYNFFKIWTRYFTRAYPSGSLLQAQGESGVWLIQDGKKRPFLTRGALTSRYDLNKVIQVAKSDLDKYTVGTPIKFPQYSLLRSPNGAVFLIIDDTRRGFASAEALRLTGINPEEIINASWEDIHAYREAAPITASTTHPTGILMQDKKTGGVYWVEDGKKAPLLDGILLRTKFAGKAITPADPSKLEAYEKIKPVLFGDGELLTSHDSPAVYVIENGLKRPIISGRIFEQLGYKWTNIISVPRKLIDLYLDGEPINEAFSDEYIEILDQAL